MNADSAYIQRSREADIDMGYTMICGRKLRDVIFSQTNYCKFCRITKYCKRNFINEETRDRGKYRGRVNQADL